MNPLTGAIAKNVVGNKLSSVSKSLGLNDNKRDSDESEGALSAKDIRKQQERDAAEREKREKLYAKRGAEREKKRSEMRAKYGLNKDKDFAVKGDQSHAKGGDEGNEQRREGDPKGEEEKQCLVM